MTPDVTPLPPGLTTSSRPPAPTLIAPAAMVPEFVCTTAPPLIVSVPPTVSVPP
jgi:hypothetical protein